MVYGFFQTLGDTWCLISERLNTWEYHSFGQKPFCWCFFVLYALTLAHLALRTRIELNWIECWCWKVEYVIATPLYRELDCVLSCIAELWLELCLPLVTHHLFKGKPICYRSIYAHIYTHMYIYTNMQIPQADAPVINKKCPMILPYFMVKSPCWSSWLKPRFHGGHFLRFAWRLGTSEEPWAGAVVPTDAHGFLHYL
jgi:hypothetical protein